MKWDVKKSCGLGLMVLMAFAAAAPATVHTPPADWPSSTTATNNPLVGTDGTWTAFRMNRSSDQTGAMVTLPAGAFDWTAYWTGGAQPSVRCDTSTSVRFGLMLTDWNDISNGWAGLALTPAITGASTAHITGTLANTVGNKASWGNGLIITEIFTRSADNTVTAVTSQNVAWEGSWDFDVTTPINPGDSIVIRMTTASYDSWFIPTLMNYSVDVQPVPEPISLSLLALGGLPLLRRRG